MKIGILTLFYGNDNWGGTLQGVALKKLIEKEYPAAKVDIIDYRSGVNIIYNSKIEQAAQYSPGEIVKKSYENIIKRINRQPGNSLSIRRQRFREFRETYKTNQHVYTDVTLPELGRDYDCLIVGSDQVWNPNVARPGFFLKNVGTSCHKISYAASIARNRLSPHEKEIICPLLELFDYISVREKTAKKILDSCLKRPVTETLDPVLMLTADEWSKMAAKKNKETVPYVLAFFFSDSLHYRQYIERYCKSKGMNLKFIPFAAQYIKNDQKGDCERLYDIGPREFISLFMEAVCIFTDSFHGSAFSIIFKKNFWVLERDKNNRVSKNSRLYDLLDKFKLTDRLIKNPEMILSIADKEIDFKNIDGLLKEYREQSLKFLYKAIGKSDDSCLTEGKTIEYVSKDNCSGCGLCTSVCPQKSITLEYDEQGFMYPIIDKSLCTECGICLKTCLKKNVLSKSETLCNSYIGYNKNEKERSDSSSGGIFCEIAKLVLKNNGVVYGAAFDKNWIVRHIRVSDDKCLKKIMRSKYVQSDISAVYSTIEQDLKNGLYVLFSGTPCQVAAVKALAEKNRIDSNLILIDFICHGVPSPGIWKSYLKYVTEGKDIQEVNFRDKNHNGWHDYYFHIKYGNNSQLNESHEINAFMRTFLSDCNLRLSCYSCKFKDSNYMSDITLGDAWKIEKDKPEWADDKGTSFFVVRSKKGAMLLKQLSDTVAYVETEYKLWTKLNPSIINAANFNLRRDSFFQQYNDQTNKEFWIIQGKMPLKTKGRYFAKRILKITGLEKIARERL